MKNIRNFSIIAHIDHGKSTLSDRLIQICGGLNEREMSAQVLDSMDLERERGITIKAQSVTLEYTSYRSQIYQLNFIDTPGHVDFSYEVFRSLAACEGALLLVDSTQGIEAQTLANCYAAMEMNIKVVPVLNKIDLPSAEPDRIEQDIKNIIGINADVVQCSAKTGFGVSDVLEKLICDIPPPQGDPSAPLQALIVDSWFDNYLGVISLIRIKNGTLYKGDKIKIIRTNQCYNVDRLGIFTPKRIDRATLHCGEVGWIACAIKNIRGVFVGDTITLVKRPTTSVLPVFKKIKPQVYAGLFPLNPNEREAFRDALTKLSLNDASLFYEPESSNMLGCGFRCGFLGLLHMEIIYERLKREYGLEIIKTTPSVIYEIVTNDNSTIYIDNPSKLPPMHNIAELREPIAQCHILLPKPYLGNIIALCNEKRGIQTGIVYHGAQIDLTYDIPMAEIVLDFFDRLKSISHGYASLDYGFKYFRKSDMVRIDLLINNKRIDVLSFITHRTHAFYRAHNIVDKLRDIIPRHQFDVVIQAAIGRNIIARSTIKQLRKDVLVKCHGGDVSRKKKLLKKQKEGKKRMKKIGNIELPSEVFLSLLDSNQKSK